MELRRILVRRAALLVARAAGRTRSVGTQAVRRTGGSSSQQRQREPRHREELRWTRISLANGSHSDRAARVNLDSCVGVGWREEPPRRRQALATQV